VAERFAILCAANDWSGPPRTAAALARHGAEICMVAPPGSYAALTRYKTADILLPFDDMRRKLPAILRTLAEEFGAHSVLAGDTLAFDALARLVAQQDALALSPATKALLARSMPSAESAALVAHTSELIAAQPPGNCSPPPSLKNPSVDQAAAFADRVSYPVALKQDGFTSGHGVARCENEAELRMSFAAVEDGRGLLVQKYVRGAVYGVAVSGVEGKAAAAFSFVKETVRPSPHGPASILRCDRREALIADACGLFERYGLNGFAGVDYIMDKSGRAYLLEINPCIVPKSHLYCFGVDLVGAFLGALRGAPAPVVAAPAHERVAIFPNEWMRDPASGHLREAYHDAPWDDPAVFAAMASAGVQLNAFDLRPSAED
jgi:biotin carboxylase